MDALSALWILAKEMGKGGGGSTEEPTVCFTLLPFALGIAWLGIQRLRRARTRRPEAA
ncbi:MAG TPA: hypothetical protein VGL99_00930 [Chloroflexota bacterium]